MKLHVLASSSAGNCYVLDADGDRLLLDAGIRFSDIQRGVGYDWKSVHGCLLTHEHKDHSKAASEVMRTGITTYTSAGTADACGLTGHNLRVIKSQEQATIGPYTVRAFDTQHDAAEPLGYLIQYKPTGEKLLYMTDTYYCKYTFPGTQYFVVECNHTHDILDKRFEGGEIDPSLRERLYGSHMSLERLLPFLRACGTALTRTVVLIHLSDGNSDERRMIRAVENESRAATVAARAGDVIALERYPF